MKDKAPQRFILLFQGRTGSSYLTQALNKYKSVKVYPEIWGGWEFIFSEDKIEWKKKEQMNWLKSDFKKHDPEASMVGFKTKLSDILDKDSFKSFVEDMQIKIIHMSRMNLVKLVLSEINAEQIFQTTQKWNLTDKNGKTGPIEIDIEHFVGKLEWRTEVEQWLKNYVNDLKTPVLSINYEQLLLDEKTLFEDISEFLDIPPEFQTGDLFKNTSDDLKEAILNFDKLKDRLSNTIYEPMLS